MNELLKALQSAKKQIKEAKLEKKGYNTYSEYHYFLPEQIEQLVFDACEKQGLFTKFDLIRSEIGETGFLTIFHIESGERIMYELATAIPVIKATNIAQQLGGCLTYTERYLKQTAFGISENTLDFDAQPKPKAAPQAAPTSSTAPSPEKWLNDTNKAGEITPEWTNILKAIAEGKVKSVADVRKYYKVSKEIAVKLEEAIS